MAWMKVDLNHNGTKGQNWIGIPGILYDEDDQVIDTALKLGAYFDYLGLTSASSTFTWWNPCTQTMEALGRLFGTWMGTNFKIYPGQGIEITVGADGVLPIKFGQGYKKHLICTETVAKYCEWSGQEDFDSLEE